MYFLPQMNARSLSSFADDDDLTSLPLVPLTEDQENAMQNVAFRKMLFFIGLQKPTTGQVIKFLILSRRLDY